MPLSEEDFRSFCPIASSLDLIGDRWTLLLIRDLYFGATRYNDFLSSPEGIPTNLLAERLKTLEAHGIVTKAPYQQKPVRYAYALTEMGLALVPVMRTLSQWGLTWLPERKAVLPEGVPWVERVRQKQQEANS
jgi:DNA-binding HxlR family transcriptional regulator